MAKLLIDKGADINAVNKLNDTALHLAIREGTSYNSFCFQNRSVEKLFTSFDLGHDEVAKLLIHNGANVNVVGQHGDTILILAAAKGKKVDFDYFLNTIFRTNKNHSLPIHFFSFIQFQDLMKSSKQSFKKVLM